MRFPLEILMVGLLGCDTQVWSFDAGAQGDDSSDGCDAACAEGEQCREGSCECLPAYTRCGPVCANLQFDLRHCGGCNLPCSGNQQCQAGTCM